MMAVKSRVRTNPFGPTFMIETPRPNFAAGEYELGLLVAGLPDNLRCGMNMTSKKASMYVSHTAKRRKK